MRQREIRGIIFDVDGVLEYQGRVYPGAVDVIDTLRERGMVLRFLTNSTLKSRASCAGRLRRKGFQVYDEEVTTASSAAAAYLAELEPRSCWIMLEREGLDEFKSFRHDTEDPAYVVVGDNRSKFDFDHLNQALRLLLKGAELIGMQSELIDGSMGDTELNVGSWVGMLERASGRPAIYIGKPSRYVFELTMRTMGLEKSQVLMVGDSVSSDIRGAKGFGIRSVLLRTGEFKEEDLDGSIEPDFVLDSIRDLLTIL